MNVQRFGKKPLLWQRLRVAPVLFASISLSMAPGLLAQQTHADTKAAVPENYTDLDAYQVYSTLLGNESGSPLVIEVKTSFFAQATSNNLGVKGKANFRKVWGPVLSDFAAKHRTPKLLTEAIPLKSSYVLITEESLSAIFKTDKGWNAFAEQYPTARGIYSFSAVGFNHAKSRAMVWMDFACGSLCSYGTFHFFEKTNGRWREVKVEAEFPVLVS